MHNGTLLSADAALIFRADSQIEVDAAHGVCALQTSSLVKVVSMRNNQHPMQCHWVPPVHLKQPLKQSILLV